MNLFYVLIALLVLAIMITVHELGHYTAGRLLGFKILDFSIGFGPAIFQFKKKDINYAVRAVPLGGACRFYGEDDEPMDAVAFNSQPVWKRIIVVLAGPFMNILFAYILAVIMMFSYGYDKVVSYDNGTSAVIITDFTSDSSRAKVCGVEKDDVILSIDGVSISELDADFDAKADTCSELISNASKDGVTVTVLRDGEQKEVFISDIYNESEQRNVLGIYMGEALEPYSFGEALGKGFDFLVFIVKTTFTAIGGWFTNGIQAGDVSGVVGTVAITAKMASYGLNSLILVTVLISLSLGIFNLLPIPALDGGRLVFLLIELIVGKPVPRKVEATIHLVGLFLLFGLMALVTVFDVLGLIRGTMFN